MMKMRDTPSTTSATRKTALSWTLMKKHMHMEQTSISGARTAMRRII